MFTHKKNPFLFMLHERRNGSKKMGEKKSSAKFLPLQKFFFLARFRGLKKEWNGDKQKDGLSIGNKRWT